ncbi:hypothetical protein C7S16_1146 [Burkholderia thailandensis]|uniref:Uncharacterized protein n=1 Tax=Burkholderia thailandensis TaxID=57975 RepID=A0AAW9CZR0_BURTH|nr:hypothetical protein [Burkholderia thailandensis]MDW9254593.1 hypothetical protein [Burkholderia thailandensis]
MRGFVFGDGGGDAPRSAWRKASRRIVAGFALCSCAGAA